MLIGENVMTHRRTLRLRRLQLQPKRCENVDGVAFELMLIAGSPKELKMFLEESLEISTNHKV